MARIRPEGWRITPDTVEHSVEVGEVLRALAFVGGSVEGHDARTVLFEVVGWIGTCDGEEAQTGEQ